MKSLSGIGWVLITTLVAIALSACVEVENNSQLNSLLSNIYSSSSPLDEATIATGLRQALEIGSAKAVQQASVADGFLGNEQIRIPLPEKLQGMANTLRTIGFSEQVDNFEVGMNRAAESAASEAKPVLLDAVKNMSLSDVVGILNGSDTAATDYFRAKTATQLQDKFQPIVHQKMQTVGVYNLYSQLMSTYSALPLVNKPDFDLENYLTDKTQDGLFNLIAQQEQSIRSDPAARTTEILQKVFAAK